MSILVPQLGRGSDYPGNCGPASVAEALRWATDHDVAPLPDEVRRAMRDLVGGTTMDEHPRGFDAFIHEAETKGWTLLPMIYRGTAPFADVVRALRAGRAVTIAIDYGRLPQRFRCADFDGLHSIFVSQIRTMGKVREVKVWDPLADGRRAGIPRGPQWYPLPVLADAAAGAARPKLAIFNVVRPGLMHPVDPVHPHPDAVAVAGVLRSAA